MARVVVAGGRGAKLWSCKRITIAVCCANLVVALFILRSYCSSLAHGFSSGPSGNPLPESKYSEDQTKGVEESIRIRKAAEPLELVRAVRELRKEFAREDGEKREKLPLPVKQKLAGEILQRLNSLKDSTNITEQRETLELWCIEKLNHAEMVDKNSLNSDVSAEEAKVLKRALRYNWLMLMEEIGLWIPADITNTENNDKPDNEPDEKEIIPGQPLPSECHAEPHTDYAGAAVRWGLTHHKETAADCCQACLDQAKRAKPGEMSCNIWVYCPSEFGCYSPDIYEHKHQECWLKQAEKPQLNFKGKYSESYRDSHPTAPVAVPWISGVVSV